MSSARDPIYSPENQILYKLIYSGLSQQSELSRDIAGIPKKKNRLDVNKIEQWVARLGLSSLWKVMLDDVSGDPIISTMECQISISGTIDLLGNRSSGVNPKLIQEWLARAYIRYLLSRNSQLARGSSQKKG